MVKLRIRNFGPIKGGFQGDDGWFEINKVTVFIGNQGSGKSTVAKLISIFMWLEKALVRGDIKADALSFQKFKEFFEYHRIENYFNFDTELEYKGKSFQIQYYNEMITTLELKNKSIKQGKIMYVPSERNFLSSIANINKVSDLIGGNLKEYAVEFRYAQKAFSNKSLKLPINNTKVIYDAISDENYIEFNKNKRLKLVEASSGFHSLVPLYWVTKYLSDLVKRDDAELLELLSTDQTIRRNKELKEFNLKELDEKKLLENIRKINDKYISKFLVNIVEEPEQNLFPNSQRELLNSLLAFNNGNNMLIMTTHSPYLINYLSLAVEAHKFKEKRRKMSDDLKSKLDSIVPANATLPAAKLVIYQMDDEKGTFERLANYYGLPSDENYLNESLGETNKLFSELLSLEDIVCQ